MPPAFTDEQREVIERPPGPLLVVSGAGTGKTTTIVGRIRHQCLTGAWDPAHVVALTHSSKAAGHIQDALRRSDSALTTVRARTFHSLALSILTRTSPYPVPAICDSVFSVMASALRACGLADLETSTIADALTEVSRLKARLETPRRTATLTSVNLSASKLLRAYEKELDRRGQMDFTDVLTRATTLLRENPSTIEQVRTDIQHVLVDEYQDTDPAQQAFLDALLGDSLDVTAVGDPRQSIYGFKGADPDVIDQFASRYPDATTLSLSLDFRSTPQVVDAANSLLPHPHAPLVPGRPDGPPVRVLTAAREPAEAKLVVREVQQLLKQGVPHSEIAILVRFNAQTAPFESAFTQAGIPHVVLDGDRFFDRPEIISALRQAWTLMTAAEDGHDTGIDLLPGQAGPYAPALPILGLALAHDGFDPNLPPAGEGAARDRWEAQAALLALAAELPDASEAAARDVLLDLAERRRQAHTLTTRAVTITTLHRSKGLEWDAVVIPRLVDGSLPSSRAKAPRELDEERRLAYVGFTRARQHLILTYSERRGNGHREWPATPSVFITAAGLDLADREKESRTTVSARSRRRTAAATSCCECGCDLTSDIDTGLGRCRRHLEEHDQAALEALLVFRRDYASDRGMPEFTVFSDRAVGALLVRRPTESFQVATCGGIGARRAQEFGDRIVDLLSRNAGPRPRTSHSGDAQ